jgi:hypothetical protein
MNLMDITKCPFPKSCEWPALSYKCHIWWDKGLKWGLAKWWWNLRLSR